MSLALPSGWRPPRYGQQTLAELLPSLAAVLGVPGYDDVLGLSGSLPDVRRIVVVLIDGLGRANLAGHPDVAPTLAGFADPCGGLDAVAPTTTPANLTSLSTGRPPGEHGIVGFTVAVPGSGQLLTHISWGTDPDPRRWQPLPSVLAAVEPTATGAVVGPAAFLGSGLTTAMHRDVGYRGTVSAGDVIAGTVEAASAAPRTLTYAYHGDLDTTGHVRGCSHPSWRAQLGLVDAMVAAILAGLPPDAALLVTADHGMIDVPATGKVDLDAIDGEDGELARQLADGVAIVAGEPRARYLHTLPGAAVEVAAAWQAMLGDRVVAMSRAEMIETGLAGARVTADAAARIGDVVCWAAPGTAFVQSRRDPGGAALIGYHGSLTETELTVPLLLGRPGR
ncbi:MAG: alkaline phosphatase family protein [Geodermatophilaceae bacterium]